MSILVDVIFMFIGFMIGLFFLVAVICIPVKLYLDYTVKMSAISKIENININLDTQDFKILNQLGGK